MKVINASGLTGDSVNQAIAKTAAEYRRLKSHVRRPSTRAIPFSLSDLVAIFRFGKEARYDVALIVDSGGFQITNTTGNTVYWKGG